MQGQFGRITEIMGGSYTLHTPGALREAMRRGADAVFHPYFASPFYLCLPINVQPEMIEGLRLDALPERPAVPPLVAAPEAVDQAVRLILRNGRVVIKAGGGTRRFPAEVRALAEAVGGPVVLSPGSSGVLPDAHPLNMHVGGSKGSINGNAAMEGGELLIVIGSRAVCQADCSGTGWRRTCSRPWSRRRPSPPPGTSRSRPVGVPQPRGRRGAPARGPCPVRRSRRRRPAAPDAAQRRAAAGGRTLPGAVRPRHRARVPPGARFNGLVARFVAGAKPWGGERFFGSCDAAGSDSTWMWSPRLRSMPCRRRSSRLWW